MQKNSHIAPILLVEDSDEDYITTKRAFDKVRISNPIHRCKDGEDALDYLFRREKYNNDKTHPLPNMILLDLNLPRVDGRQVLEEVKRDHQLKRIPVIILTTSADESDIDFCYVMGANSYLQKPVNFDKFIEAVKRLKDYWFEVVILPKQMDKD